MFVEQLINDYLKAQGKFWRSIEDRYWTWDGLPESLLVSGKMPYEYLQVYIGVDRLIRHATLEECLTSSSTYIRECKKWYEVNESEK